MHLCCSDEHGRLTTYRITSIFIITIFWVTLRDTERVHCHECLSKNQQFFSVKKIKQNNAHLIIWTFSASTKGVDTPVELFIKIICWSIGSDCQPKSKKLIVRPCGYAVKGYYSISLQFSFYDVLLPHEKTLLCFLLQAFGWKFEFGVWL